MPMPNDRVNRFELTSEGTSLQFRLRNFQCLWGATYLCACKPDPHCNLHKPLEVCRLGVDSRATEQCVPRPRIKEVQA